MDSPSLYKLKPRRVYPPPGWLELLVGPGLLHRAILVPMVLHSAFVVPAIRVSPGVLWAIVAVDALLVGCLAAIIAATNVAIARRAVENSGAILVSGSATR